MFYEFTSTTVRNELESIGDDIEWTLHSETADARRCLADVDGRLSELLARIDVREERVNTHPSKMTTEDLRDECLDGAECLYDPELHDGPDAIEWPDEREARVAVAMEICAACPVASSCVEYARRVQPERGIWAGFTAEQIRLLDGLLTLLGMPAEAA